MAQQSKNNVLGFLKYAVIVILNFVFVIAAEDRLILGNQCNSPIKCLDDNIFTFCFIDGENVVLQKETNTCPVNYKCVEDAKQPCMLIDDETNILINTLSTNLIAKNEANTEANFPINKETVSNDDNLFSQQYYTNWFNKVLALNLTKSDYLAYYLKQDDDINEIPTTTLPVVYYSAKKDNQLDLTGLQLEHDINMAINKSQTLDEIYNGFSERSTTISFLLNHKFDQQSDIFDSTTSNYEMRQDLFEANETSLETTTIDSNTANPFVFQYTNNDFIETTTDNNDFTENKILFDGTDQLDDVASITNLSNLNSSFTLSLNNSYTFENVTSVDTAESNDATTEKFELDQSEATTLDNIHEESLKNGFSSIISSEIDFNPLMESDLGLDQNQYSDITTGLQTSYQYLPTTESIQTTTEVTDVTSAYSENELDLTEHFNVSPELYKEEIETEKNNHFLINDLESKETTTKENYTDDLENVIVTIDSIQNEIVDITTENYNNITETYDYQVTSTDFIGKPQTTYSTTKATTPKRKRKKKRPLKNGKPIRRKHNKRRKSSKMPTSTSSIALTKTTTMSSPIESTTDNYSTDIKLLTKASTVAKESLATSFLQSTLKETYPVTYFPLETTTTFDTGFTTFSPSGNLAKQASTTISTTTYTSTTTRPLVTAPSNCLLQAKYQAEKCNQYYECLSVLWWTDPVLRTCPSSYKYDTDSQTCIFENNIKC